METYSTRLTRSDTIQWMQYEYKVCVSIHEKRVTATQYRRRIKRRENPRGQNNAKWRRYANHTAILFSLQSLLVHVGSLFVSPFHSVGSFAAPFKPFVRTWMLVCLQHTADSRVIRNHVCAQQRIARATHKLCCPQQPEAKNNSANESAGRTSTFNQTRPPDENKWMRTC